MFVSNGKLNASYDEFAAMCHKSSLIYLSSNYCVLKVNANKRNIAVNGYNRQYGDCMTSLDWGLLSAEPSTIAGASTL